MLKAPESMKELEGRAAGALGEHRSTANQQRSCMEVTNATYFAAAGGRAGTVASANAL